ncbi:hypothetical protein R3P38DRAFT_3126495 [Favolaschia claudopus]|uniref:Uncharacterized protein n=1 Tax=Favolaschia claudopus TaxID=2862362 RepID=A0AAV9Z9V5_9AGAR
MHLTLPLTQLLVFVLGALFTSSTMGVTLPAPEVCCILVPGACGRADTAAPLVVNPVPLSSVKAPNVCCCMSSPDCKRCQGV